MLNSKSKPVFEIRLSKLILFLLTSYKSQLLSNINEPQFDTKSVSTLLVLVKIEAKLVITRLLTGS